MQNNEYSPADMIRVAGFKQKDSTTVMKLSVNTMRRLKKLAPWRIDPASIVFPKGAFMFEGGYATVVRGRLASSTDDTRDQRESSSESATSNDRLAKLEGDSERRHAEPDNGRMNYDDEVGAEGQEWRSNGEQQWKSVAVKKMRPKAAGDSVKVLSLALREAEFLVGLSHPYVIKLEGFVEDVSNRMIWLVFPWQENGTLKDFIASADWEIPERISLIWDVAQGVEYLHGREPPICHGDLKSVNILVNSKFKAVITDFGSARYCVVKSPNEERERAQHESQPTVPVEATFCPSTNTITLTGVHYTTRWASPELLETNEPSLASDIWALGWVGYEVMTGSVPFHDVQETVVVMRVLGGDLPSISGDARMLLIQRLCTLLRHCWSIEPNDRPTAEDCITALKWMPMVTPNPVRTTGTADFANRSPELLVKLGSLHWQQSDCPKALEYYTKALSVYTDIGDREGKAKASRYLADIHLLQGKYNQAFRFYSECLQIWTEIGGREGRASALRGLAAVHRMQGKYSQAYALYSECLQIWTDMGHKQGRAIALRGLALIHELRKEYTQALALYSECLQLHTDIGNTRGRADALNDLARFHMFQKEYSLALPLYSECLQIHTDVGNRTGRASALRGLATAQMGRGEHTQAFALASESLAIYTDIGYRKEISTLSFDLAWWYLICGNYRQAMPLFSTAIKLGSLNDFTAIRQWRASRARIGTKITAVAQPTIRENLQKLLKKLHSTWLRFTRQSMLPMSSD